MDSNIKNKPVTSPTTLSSVGNLGFGFGKAKQKKEEVAKKQEMTNAEYEYMCYNATKRVESNREEAIHLETKLFD